MKIVPLPKFPLPGDVSLRAATTLLIRMSGENLKVITKFKHVSRHPEP